MAASARELKVWQDSVVLGGDVIRAARRVTRRETKAFTDALMLSASSVAVAIADAHARASAAEERECYVKAKRSLVALDTQLAIARNGGILPSSVHAHLTARVAALSQRVSNHLNFAERHGTAIVRAAPADAISVELETLAP